MSHRLSQIIHGLAPIVWGAVPVWFHATSRLDPYLTARFHPIALAGGIGMIILGLFNILTAGRDSDHCCHDHGDHEHAAQNPFLSLGLMILPVVLALVWTTDSYSAKALARKGLNDDSRQRAAVLLREAPPLTREALDKYTPKTPDGFYQFSLTQLVWSAGDEVLMDVYGGLPVELTGQLIEDPNSDTPQRMRLFQIFMTCCAADAQVLGLTVEFPDTRPTLPPQTWVTLRGTVAYEKTDGPTRAVLKVTAPAVPMDMPEPQRRPGF